MAFIPELKTMPGKNPRVASSPHQKYAEAAEDLRRKDSQLHGKTYPILPAGNGSLEGSYLLYCKVCKRTMKEKSMAL